MKIIKVVKIFSIINSYAQHMYKTSTVSYPAGAVAAIKIDYLITKMPLQLVWELAFSGWAEALPLLVLTSLSMHSALHSHKGQHSGSGGFLM